ncbi:hypothetical protein GBA52_014132 [Prunus armeniaca]|nr:hypothetical protein GBA52_014132 [Prunus armeniaca]
MNNILKDITSKKEIKHSRKKSSYTCSRKQEIIDRTRRMKVEKGTALLGNLTRKDKQALETRMEKIREPSGP